MCVCVRFVCVCVRFCRLCVQSRGERESARGDGQGERVGGKRFKLKKMRRAFNHREKKQKSLLRHSLGLRVAQRVEVLAGRAGHGDGRRRDRGRRERHEEGKRTGRERREIAFSLLSISKNGSSSPSTSTSSCSLFFPLFFFFGSALFPLSLFSIYTTMYGKKLKLATYNMYISV